MYKAIRSKKMAMQIARTHGRYGSIYKKFNQETLVTNVYEEDYGCLWDDIEYLGGAGKYVRPATFEDAQNVWPDIKRQKRIL